MEDKIPPVDEGTMGGQPTFPTLSPPSQLPQRVSSISLQHSGFQVMQENANQQVSHPRLSQNTSGSDDSSAFSQETSPSDASYHPELLQPTDDDWLVPPRAHQLVSPTLQKLKQKITAIKNNFHSSGPERSEYLVVTEIQKDLVQHLRQEKDIFKGVRASIHHQKPEIIYRIMVGKEHDQIVSLFSALIQDAMGAMGLSYLNRDWVSRGAGRFTGRVSDKEPDYSFYPNPKPLGSGNTDTPSMVLEVGLTESFPHLRTDVAWWHANTHQETKLVVLIKISLSPVVVFDIEVWKEVANNRDGPTTRNRPPKFMECTQQIRHQNGVITGGPLVLDFELLMRRPPQSPLERDVLLGDREIAVLCSLLEDQ